MGSVRTRNQNRETSNEKKNFLGSLCKQTSQVIESVTQYVRYNTSHLTRKGESNQRERSNQRTSRLQHLNLSRRRVIIRNKSLVHTHKINKYVFFCFQAILLEWTCDGWSARPHDKIKRQPTKSWKYLIMSKPSKKEKTKTNRQWLSSVKKKGERNCCVYNCRQKY